MAQGPRQGARTIPLDMGGKKVVHLGRGSDPDSAARLDDLPQPWDGPMTPIGSDYAGGNEPKFARGPHSHPAASVADVGSTLYPARLVNTLNRGMAICAYLGEHFAGGTTPLLEGWIVPGTDPNVLEHTEDGPIHADWLDGVDPDVSAVPGEYHQSSLVGKMVFAYLQGDTTAHGIDEVRQGPWIIEEIGRQWYHDPGDPDGYYRYRDVKARLRRPPGYTIGSTIAKGATWQMQTGNVYGSDFFTLTNDPSATVGTTLLTFDETEGPTYDWTYETEMLTGPQLSSEGASTETVDTSVTFLDGDASAPEGFATLAGTPGVDALPAGPWQNFVEALWIDPSTPPSDGSTTTFKWRRLIVNAAGDSTISELEAMESPPISNTAPQAYHWDYDDPGHSITPDQRLVFLPTLHTTSTTPVKLWIRYNSAARGTKIVLPFAMAVTGSSDGYHPHLSGRNEPNQHKLDALEPAGQLLFPLLAITPASSEWNGGWIDCAGYNHIEVTGTTLASEFKGLRLPAAMTGKTVVVEILFTDPVTVRHAASSPPADHQALSMPWSPTSTRDRAFAHGANLSFRHSPGLGAFACKGIT